MKMESKGNGDSEKVGPVIDWEEALSLYQSHVASGIEVLIRRDTVELAQLAKYAPENVLARAVPHWGYRVSY